MPTTKRPRPPRQRQHNVVPPTLQACAALLGGAQSLFGVVPDLAAFGKALGNGMPISAVVGRADIMREMEEVFFSGTFGGEALSLAASLPLADALPLTHAVNILQDPWLGFAWQWPSLLAVLGFLTGSILLALRFFRWN